MTPFLFWCLALTCLWVFDQHFCPRSDRPILHLRTWAGMIWWPRKSKPRSSPLGDGGLEMPKFFSRPPRWSPPKRGMLKSGMASWHFLRKPPGIFQQKTGFFVGSWWQINWCCFLFVCGGLATWHRCWKNIFFGLNLQWNWWPYESTNPLGDSGQKYENDKMDRFFHAFLQGKKHRRPTKRSTNFLLHISRLPTRPAVKGATDTSNFDDYPDSDQEPPAVNALGTSGRKMDEG